LGDFGDRFDAALRSCRTTSTAAAELRRAAEDLHVILAEADTRVRDRLTLDVKAIDERQKACGTAWGVLGDAARAQSGAVEGLSVALQPVLAQRSGKPGWAALLAIAEAPETVVAALRRERARVTVRRRITEAQKAIEGATGRVLDRRFQGMSDEVRRCSSDSAECDAGRPAGAFLTSKPR
jgi:hypothetical protein